MDVVEDVHTRPPHWWRARPLASRAIQALAVVLTIVPALAAVELFSRFVPRVPGSAGEPVWFAAAAAVALAAGVLTSHLTTELLPLAALYRLTLVFPDRTPSRYRVALRARMTNRATLERQLAATATPSEAAIVLLQLIAKLNKHDRLTRGHSERVRAYVDLLADELGLDETEAAKLRWAGLLHDVGKLAVPSTILNKPGPLDDDEFEVIKRHPARGAHLAEPLEPWLGEWIRSIGEHHERWDGGGYPARLAGDDIALGARIVSVADAFDVMTSYRSYTARRSMPDARNELVRCSGSQFDPAVVRAMLAISLPKLALVVGPLAVLASLPYSWARTGWTGPRASTASQGFGNSATELTSAVASGLVAAALVLSGGPLVDDVDTDPEVVAAPERAEPSDDVPVAPLSAGRRTAPSGPSPGWPAVAAPFELPDDARSAGPTPAEAVIVDLEPRPPQHHPPAEPSVVAAEVGGTDALPPPPATPLDDAIPPPPSDDGLLDDLEDGLDDLVERLDEVDGDAAPAEEAGDDQRDGDDDAPDDDESVGGTVEAVVDQVADAAGPGVPDLPAV